MTTLDARASSAAHAINAGVAEFTPAASFDTVVMRQQRWRTTQAGFAGAVAAAVILLVGIAIAPSPEPQVAEPTITVPTIPIQDPDLVAPIPPPVTVPADTTTTSTTAVPVTTPPPTTQADTTPPPLDISTPRQDQHFEIDKIEFRGTTEPGASVFAGKYEANVDDEGNWSIVLILSPGANGALFTAADAAGNETQARVTVHLDVPEATTTTTKAPKEEIEFTAHNVYGFCEEEPPFDVYWGTAPSGTPIYVESEYGSGSTAANDKGEWELSVTFPEAPANKEFTVKVKDDKGNKVLFGFKFKV